MTDALQPWDRRPGESARAYEAFRAFRDLGPLRTFDDLVSDELARVTLAKWSRRNDWRDRAQAWDTEVHRAEDARRLEAIRSMHDTHQRAGRAVMQMALRALSAVQPEQIPPYAAARLLELGTRLERDTITHSVEELQGIPPPAADDPWETIERELDRLPAAD